VAYGERFIMSLEVTLSFPRHEGATKALVDSIEALTALLVAGMTARSKAQQTSIGGSVGFGPLASSGISHFPPASRECD
jgi:hypothetical protein